MLWLGKPRSAAAEQAQTAAYLNNQIGRGISDAQWAEIHRADREFFATKPEFRQSCLPCGASHDWVAAENETGRFWVCTNCHRRPLTDAEWAAELVERKKQAAAKEAEIAAANTPAATRAALKERVAKFGQAQLSARKLRAAAEKAEDDAFDARRAVDAARQTLQQAPTVDGNAIVAQILADAPFAPPASQKAAKEALADAEETAQQATALASMLATKAKEAEDSLKNADWWLKPAVVACLRANSAKSLAAFIAETDALKADLVARMLGLQFLVKQGILDDTPAGDIFRFFSYGPEHWQIDRGQHANIAGRWQAVIDRLTRDASAPAELR